MPGLPTLEPAWALVPALGPWTISIALREHWRCPGAPLGELRASPARGTPPALAWEWSRDLSPEGGRLGQVRR